MTPGPDLIYKCPQCGSLLKNHSLCSGNTLGAFLYSDGKQDADMLPNFPDLTKWKECNSIFWLCDLKIIGKYAPWLFLDEEISGENPFAFLMEGRKIKTEQEKKWDNSPYAEFLNIKDLFRALNENKNKKKNHTHSAYDLANLQRQGTSIH
jgi:hypothetical protein